MLICHDKRLLVEYGASFEVDRGTAIHAKRLRLNAPSNYSTTYAYHIHRYFNSLMIHLWVSSNRVLEVD